MHALVFAAGRGSRLRPYTDRTPKPLLEVGDRSILERTLRAVADAGVAAITVVVGYRAEEIVDAIGTTVDGVPVGYAQQDERAGLAHAVRTAFADGYGIADAAALEAADDAPADVMTVNGDNVFGPACDLSRLVERHRESDVDGTLVLDRVSRNDAAATARLSLADDGTVRSVDSTTAASGGARTAYMAGGVQTHDACALLEACREVDRGQTGEYELADALAELVDDRRYVGVDLEGWHANVNTPADLERARERVGDGSR